MSTGPFSLSGEKLPKLQGIDPCVLVDALSDVMGYEEKEMSKPCNLGMVLMLNTATMVLGCKQRACQLPLFSYLVERMCALCYERPWYCKFGG